jgi:hypothetical protein
MNGSLYYIQTNTVVAEGYFGAIQQLPITTTVSAGMNLIWHRKKNNYLNNVFGFICEM